MKQDEIYQMRRYVTMVGKHKICWHLNVECVYGYEMLKQHWQFEHVDISEVVHGFDLCRVFMRGIY